MARKLLGKNAVMRGELMLGLELANVPARAGLTRALSLMDLALWDIACKRAQQPLYQLIEGCGTPPT